MILYTTVPVISYQYISYSTLPGKSNGYVDTTTDWRKTSQLEGYFQWKHVPSTCQNKTGNRLIPGQ